MKTGADARSLPTARAHRDGIAILTLTRGGARLAARLASRLTDATRADATRVKVHLPERLGTCVAVAEPARLDTFAGPLARRLSNVFATSTELVFIGAAGILVRLVAPLLRDKRSDPAVLVMDEAGRFVIPILSGHLGGANASARRIAALLGAIPVLTTASDVQCTIAVDLLGRELGWQVEADAAALLHTAAAVVNGERVVIIEEACGREWWPMGQPLPASLCPVTCWEQAGEASAYLWVTHQPIAPALRAALGPKLVVYRPPAPAIPNLPL